MKYIPGDKNIAAGAMYSFLLGDKHRFTHKYNYTMKILLIVFEIEKLMEDTSTLNFKTMKHYQWKDSGIQDCHIFQTILRKISKHSFFVDYVILSHLQLTIFLNDYIETSKLCCMMASFISPPH